MDHMMVHWIEKARRYAEEPRRFSFSDFHIRFQGTNHEHVVGYEGGKFDCDCHTFLEHDYCSHTMALERMFQEMLQT